LNEKPQTVSLSYYGISPWEIEVIYSLFNEKFEVIQEETGRDEYLERLGFRTDSEEFVSALTITIPLPFSEEFFKWFELRAWDKVKHIIKEMKRRRGNRKAIRVEIIFKNEEWYNIKRDGKNPILSDNDERLPDYPNIKFVIDSSENHNFNSAIEKIDFMVELLPYHLNHSKMKKFCKKLMEVRYDYDVHSSKWYVGHVLSFDGGMTFYIDDLRD
jgi:hypothetical protein